MGAMAAQIAVDHGIEDSLLMRDYFGCERADYDSTTVACTHFNYHVRFRVDPAGYVRRYRWYNADPDCAPE
jgi:hypothetical protein